MHFPTLIAAIAASAIGAHADAVDAASLELTAFINQLPKCLLGCAIGTETVPNDAPQVLCHMLQNPGTLMSLLTCSLCDSGEVSAVLDAMNNAATVASVTNDCKIILGENMQT
ncbi:hypothetical protein HDU82_004186 [Entophlyctis luteolus]|nr:hypothetical protein HDU82_004186 [Entophlyctis luteolus]